VPLEELLRAAESSDARVRFRAALGLGESHEPRAIAALAKVAALGVDDRWTRAAVLSGIAGREKDFVLAFLAVTKGEEVGEQEVLRSAGRAFKDYESLVPVLAALPKPRGNDDWCTPATAALLLAHSESSGKRLKVDSKDIRWEPTLRCAEQNAMDAKYPAAVRLLYVSLLGRFEDFSNPPKALFFLAAKETNAELRNTAARALATFDNPEVAVVLLAKERLAALTPLDREVTVSALIARPAHASRVLDAVESGALPRTAVSAAGRTALSKSKDAAIKARAEKLFGAAAEGDRMKAYEASKAVLALAPNAKHGKEVFKTICSSCHRLDQEGYNVGPDLLGMRNQPKESILLHIVVPDYEIIAAFAASNVELKDGRTLAGIIISDTAESITLRQPLGVEENIPRANIKTLTASEHSLMPAGLEATMKPQDLADLLSFLKGEAQ
jgi:putative heme-binding domain-containing protein